MQNDNYYIYPNLYRVGRPILKAQIDYCRNWIIVGIRILEYCRNWNIVGIRSAGELYTRKEEARANIGSYNETNADKYMIFERILILANDNVQLQA